MTGASAPHSISCPNLQYSGPLPPVPLQEQDGVQPLAKQLSGLAHAREIDTCRSHRKAPPQASRSARHRTDPIRISPEPTRLCRQISLLRKHPNPVASKREAKRRQRVRPPRLDLACSHTSQCREHEQKVPFPESPMWRLDCLACSYRNSPFHRASEAPRESAVVR